MLGGQSLVQAVASTSESPGSRIRIVLVEDHSILRAGLRALLEIEGDFDIVGDYGCVEACLGDLEHSQPDLIITDLNLPGRSGTDLIVEIRQRAPRIRKLVLTAHDDEEIVRATLSAGADGYILKNANSAELSLAIRTVMGDESYLCKAIASKVLSGYLSGNQPHLRPAMQVPITGREREVLTRIALGKPNKTIARDLGISPKTVEKHRSNLMRKLKLHNAAAITRFAISSGMTGTGPLNE